MIGRHIRPWPCVASSSTEKFTFLALFQGVWSRAIARTLFVAVFVFSLLCTTLTLIVHAQSPAVDNELSDPGPQIWIEFPLEGQILPLEALTFAIIASDLVGISSVDLRVNGQAVPVSEAVPLSNVHPERLLLLEKHWTPLAKGEYVAEARARSSRQIDGESVTVKFCIVECEPVQTPTPSPAPAKLIVPTNTPFAAIDPYTPTPTVFQDIATDTPTPTLVTPTLTPSLGYDLYVRRMDFTPPNPNVGDTVQMAIMIASDIAPQGAPFFPASSFRWRPGPAFAWVEETCPANTQYASCLKNVTFSYPSAGSYPFEVQADHLNQIAETDETNNTETWIITVGQAVPSEQISFRSDEPYVDGGGCTVLRWDVEGAQAVYLDGAGVDGHSNQEVCPCEPTTYTLEVVKGDGSRESRLVFIDVYGSCGGIDTPSQSGSETDSP